MKTKSILLPFALAALLAAPALRAAVTADNPPAPPPGHPDMAERREHRMEHLDRKLKLTDAEKTQINAIWDKAESDGTALREDNSLSRQERRHKLRALMKSTHDHVRAVLTPDQQKTFDQMRPPRGMRKGDRPPPPDGDAPQD